jgi:hypothetical protein
MPNIGGMGGMGGMPEGMQMPEGMDQQQMPESMPGGMPGGGPGGMPGGAGGPPGGMSPGRGAGGVGGAAGGAAFGGGGGRGEYGVIQSAGPAMVGGHEEEAPLDPHPEQIVIKVDGAIQSLDLGVMKARKRGGNARLELSEGTHTAEHEVKVGALGDKFKGFVINSHDVTIVGKGVGKTKIVGAIKSYQAKNLIIQDLTITASVNGSALWIEGSDIRVERVEIMGSSLDGLTIQEGMVTLIDVEIHANKRRGLFVCGFETHLVGNNLNVHHNTFHGMDVVAGAMVELYGLGSKFHHNGVTGIIIEFNSNVDLFLDEGHVTFHDNEKNDTIVEEGSKLRYVGHQEM